MRVLLLQTCQWTSVSKGYKIPLGLAYLAAYLKKDGHQVEGIDLNYPFGKEKERYLNEDKEIANIIRDMNPQIIGMTCYSNNRFNVYFWAKTIKRHLPEARVVLGGPHATFLCKEILQQHPEIDFIIRFEGERPFSSLLAALENQKPLECVPNLVFRDENNSVLINESEPFIENLDDLPFPDRTFFYGGEQLVFAGKAIDGREDLFKTPTIHMITSRGCPFKCKFCCTGHFLGGTTRFRSPQNVIQELVEIKEKWPQITNLLFHDDTMTVNKRHLHAICELMIENKLDFRWGAWSRIDVLDRKSVRLMREAGCILLKSGIESGSQRVLDSMGKKINVHMALKNIQIAREEGLTGSYNFLFGFPGESVKEAYQTVDFIRRLDLEPRNLRIGGGVQFYPGTELTGSYVKKVGEFNWDDPPGQIRKDFKCDPYGNPLFPRRNISDDMKKKLKKAIIAPRLSDLRKNGFALKNGCPAWAEPPFQDVQVKQLAWLDNLIRSQEKQDDLILLVGDGPVEYSLQEEFREQGYNIKHEPLFSDGELPSMTPYHLFDYQDDIFDLIIVLNMLGRQDAEKMLPELRRVLAPDGSAVFLEMNQAHLYNRLKFLFFGTFLLTSEFSSSPAFHEAMERLRDNGFEISSLKGYGVYVPDFLKSLLPNRVSSIFCKLRARSSLSVFNIYQCRKQAAG